MDELKKIYQESFKLYGDSPSAVHWPKGRQYDRYSALTKNIEEQTFSILDFGCGLGHLIPFLESKFKNVNYVGVDIVDEFINFNRSKYSKASFFSLEEFIKTDLMFDYCVASGVFNIKYFEDEARHLEKVKEILQLLFQRCTRYVAVDFMTDLVDFRQSNTFHASPTNMFDLLVSEFSRRVVIDHSYLPYEFCLTSFKHDEIIRPENVYGEL